MTETKMLGIAFSSTLAMSLIAAGVLFFMVAGEAAILIGSTLAAAVTYVLICLLCLPYVQKPVLEPVEEREDYV